jgi:hypothetical protein
MATLNLSVQWRRQGAFAETMNHHGSVKSPPLRQS